MSRTTSFPNSPLCSQRRAVPRALAVIVLSLAALVASTAAHTRELSFSPSAPAGAVAPEAFLQIHKPTAIAWSPDGRQLAYRLTNAVASEIRVSTLDSDVTVTVARDLPPDRYARDRPDLRWSADGQRVIYRAERSYYSVPPAETTPTVLFSGTFLGELVQLSPDQSRVSFIRDGDLWVQSVAGGQPRRLTRGEGLHTEDTQFFSRLMQWPQWSPDSTRITYLSPTGGGYKIAIVEVASGSIQWIVPAEDIWGLTIVEWAPDSQRLAISRLSTDFKRKKLTVAKLAGGEVEVWEDTDDKWVDHNVEPSFHVSWTPDGERLAFLSNRSGWRHLYLSDAEGGDTRQITSGSYDVTWTAWSPVGGRLTALSSSGHLQQRRPWVISADNGDQRALIEQPGIASDSWWPGYLAFPSWSPDGALIAFSYSSTGDPFQLMVAEVNAATAPRAIFSAAEEDLDVGKRVRSETVSFESEDGTRIPALLITATGLDPRQKHAALVHAYGGWGQMASHGWAIPAKSQLFHYLALKGFVILIVDPRGSEGYGDEHAKGLYLEGGGVQSEDLVAAARYLASLGYVDPSSIALHGHSYGGFLTLQTMVRFPEAFAAGILQAGVFQRSLSGAYNTYDLIRFGSPDREPELWAERTNPQGQVARLRGPVLVLHGTRDFNVSPAYSEQLVGALQRAERDVEYMVYPGEPHDWVSYHAKLDYMRRVEGFLDRALRSR